MSVRLRTLSLVLLIGVGCLQIAEAKDPRVKPAKITDHGVKPAQKYKTAQPPKKVKFKPAKQKKFKQPKFKQSKHRA
jgi:hypothetical protein